MILPNNKDKILKITYFFAFFLIMGGIFLSSQWPTKSEAGGSLPANISEPVQLELEPEQEQETLQVEEIVLDNSSLTAESAISIEFGNGIEDKILFEHDKIRKLPIASLAKIMTALVVLENYNLSQQVVISKEAMDQVGEQGNLKAGEQISIGNLLHLTLIESSNRAAFALSEVIGKEKFIELMNKKSLEIGLQDTHFDDSTGLSNQTYSTAEDLVKLTKHVFFNYPLFSVITSLKGYDLHLSDGTFHHTLTNTNELLDQDGVIGGKTGYTYEAGGCFMVIQKRSEDKYVAHVVLGAEDRLLEMYKLIKNSSEEQYQRLIGG